MKRMIAAAACLAAMAMAGCSPATEKGAEDAAPADAAPAVAAADAAAPAVATTGAAQPAAPDAPAFAVVYPGGAPDAPALLAESPAGGPGGSVTFTTDASPETIVAFYRQRAEASGLKPINAMNQGETRAYSAGDGVDGTGKLLSVVATPVEGGLTNVQLMWGAGR